jgi:hypothetical protein
MIENGKVRHSAEILRKLIEEGTYAPTSILELLDKPSKPVKPTSSTKKISA